MAAVVNVVVASRFAGSCERERLLRVSLQFKPQEAIPAVFACFAVTLVVRAHVRSVDRASEAAEISSCDEGVLWAR